MCRDTNTASETYDCWRRPKANLLFASEASSHPKSHSGKTPTDYLIAIANSLLFWILLDGGKKHIPPMKWNVTEESLLSKKPAEQHWKTLLAVVGTVVTLSSWSAQTASFCQNQSSRKSCFLSLVAIGECSFLVLLWTFLGSPEDKSLIDFNLPCSFMYFHPL